MTASAEATTATVSINQSVRRARDWAIRPFPALDRVEYELAEVAEARHSDSDEAQGARPVLQPPVEQAAGERADLLRVVDADGELRRLLPGSVGRELRDRARGVDPRGLELDVERISISVENTFERDVSDRERLHDELRGMAAEVAGALQRRGQVARTVTTKLRYADFSIRSRSTSLRAGVDAPGTIGELACRLLDRGLRDRPGALRLVGVGVSGLADFRQLELDGSEGGNRLSTL